MLADLVVPQVKALPGKGAGGRLPAPGQPYDPQLADAAVSPWRMFVDRRFWEVITACLRFAVSAARQSLPGAAPVDRHLRLRGQAARLRQLLVDLGPTFIKVGQFLAARQDLIPALLAEELAQLQDRVPPFDYQAVRRLIACDLGAQPEELFSEFEPRPIASASIGQVHKARLADGRWLAVKVQRPDLIRRFYKDIGYMRMFARAAACLGNGCRAGAWLELSNEFGRTLFAEVDFIAEGRNADRLRGLLRYRPRIKVPRVWWRYTGRRVLALEYLPGTKIDNLPELRSRGLDLQDLANLIVDCYVEQVVSAGFFHADPHAGNLAVDAAGCLVIYDFGVVGEISPARRAAFQGCLEVLVSGRAERAVPHLKALGLVAEGAPAEPLERTLAALIGCWRGRDLLDLDFSLIERDLESLIARNALRLPAELLCLLRTGSAIDGLARTLKPQFNFVRAARRTLARRSVLTAVGAALKMGLEGNASGQNLVRGTRRVQAPGGSDVH
jgi:predicted unusual protein kinase regulating ubiquinone biosynthesis (AarF/ABC1/UbiB family)